MEGIKEFRAEWVDNVATTKSIRKKSDEAKRMSTTN